MSDAQQTKDTLLSDTEKAMGQSLLLIEMLRNERDQWKQRAVEAERLVMRQANHIRKLEKAKKEHEATCNG